MRGKRVTWSDYLIMPVRVLIGRGPPLCHRSRYTDTPFNLSYLHSDLIVHPFFKNSCRSLFLLPPSFAYFHIRLSQITTISARQTFGQPFLSKYNFVIHYELVQKHWVFARFCSLEYIHTRKSHLLQVNQREKLGANCPPCTQYLFDKFSVLDRYKSRTVNLEGIGCYFL